MAEERLIEVVDAGGKPGIEGVDARVEGRDIGADVLSESSEVLMEGSHFLSQRSQVLALDTKQEQQ